MNGNPKARLWRADMERPTLIEVVVALLVVGMSLTSSFVGQLLAIALIGVMI